MVEPDEKTSFFGSILILTFFSKTLKGRLKGNLLKSEQEKNFIEEMCTNW